MLSVSLHKLRAKGKIIGGSLNTFYYGVRRCVCTSSLACGIPQILSASPHLADMPLPRKLQYAADIHTFQCLREYLVNTTRSRLGNHKSVGLHQLRCPMLNSKTDAGQCRALQNANKPVHEISLRTEAEAYQKRLLDAASPPQIS
jgi:hypothetical protein